MAKKTRKTTTNRTTSVWDIVKFCAYVAMVIAAIAAMLAFVFGLLAKLDVHIGWAGRVTGICTPLRKLRLSLR